MEEAFSMKSIKTSAFMTVPYAGTFFTLMPLLDVYTGTFPKTLIKIDWLSRVWRPTTHIIAHNRGRVLWVKWPNQQCQSTEGNSSPKDQASTPPGPMLQYYNIQYTVIHKIGPICTQKNESKHRELPCETSPIQKTVKARLHDTTGCQSGLTTGCIV